MKNYLDNILKGFKPVGSQVMLDSEARQTPNFVVVDIDQDGMPELLFAYQSQGERYIGILKKENTQWYLFNVSLEKNQKAIGLGNLVHILDGINLTSKDVGKVMSMEDLLGTGDQAFVSFVDNTLNHGVVMQTPAIPSNFNPLATTFSKESIIGNLTVEETGMTAEQIIQQSGSLQSPENVNTPQAQQALSQNVITPIMSVNSIGQNQGFNQNTNQFGQNQGFNQNANQFGQNQGFNANMNQFGQNQGLNQNMNQLGQNEGFNTNQSGMTVEQIIQESGPLPLPQNVNTPQAQQALSQNVTTPIMSVNSIGQNQGFNPNMNQLGQSQGLNVNTNQLGQNQGLNMNQPGMTGAQIIQQSGPLPSPENVNTLQAQQALSQDVTTPIMSVSSIGQNQGLNTNVNQLGQTQGLNTNMNQFGMVEYEEPKVTMSIINGSNSINGNDIVLDIKR